MLRLDAPSAAGQRRLQRAHANISSFYELQGALSVAYRPWSRSSSETLLRHHLASDVRCKAVSQPLGVAGDKFAKLDAAATPFSALADVASVHKKSCYGCGASLQIEVPSGAGYVKPDKYAVKKMHRQLSKVLCERCSGLSNGAMIPGVEDFTQKLQRRGLDASFRSKDMSPAAAGAPAVLADGAGEPAARVVDTAEAAAAVEGAADARAKGLVTPEELRAQLMVVRGKPAVVVLLVDLLDASGTLMGRVRDIVGSNPVVLVGTKMDLLPYGFVPKQVADWLGEAAARKHLNVVSVHLVSSHTGEGVPNVTSKICRERKGRDVYVVGAANVGKSAFVRAVLKEMSKFESPSFDPAALSNGRYLPVESAMPGTTLGMIPLRAFASGGTLYDTPGVHLHHRVQHMLAPDELKLLHPRKRLQAFVPLAPRDLTVAGSAAGDIAVDNAGMTAAMHVAAGSSTNGATPGTIKLKGFTPPPLGSSTGITGDARDVLQGPGGRAASRPSQYRPPPSPACATYLWSDLLRLDLLLVPASTRVAFYGPACMSVTGVPLLKEGQEVAADESGSLSSGSTRQRPLHLLSCADSVAARGGLVPHDLLIKSDGGRGALSDIAISGLPGWVTVWAPAAKRDVRVRAWVPRGVDVFLRPPLPLPNPISEGDKQEDDGADAEAAVSEAQMRSMLQNYGDDSDPVHDPAWWEAMVRMVDESSAADGGSSDEDEPQEDEGDGRGSASPAARGTLQRRAAAQVGRISATVEDVLWRPRLDLAAHALGVDGDGEGGVELWDDDDGKISSQGEGTQRQHRSATTAANRWGGGLRARGPARASGLMDDGWAETVGPERTHNAVDALQLQEQGDATFSDPPCQQRRLLRAAPAQAVVSTMVRRRARSSASAPAVPQALQKSSDVAPKPSAKTLATARVLAERGSKLAGKGLKRSKKGRS